MSASRTSLATASRVYSGSTVALSQRALDLAGLLSHLPQETLQTLSQLLETSLADPTAGERRDGRLGLLVRLILTTGEIPGIYTYMSAQQAAAARGEDWPSAEGLTSAYLSWNRATSAALRYVDESSGATVPSSYKRNHGRGSLTIKAMLAAGVRYRIDYGDFAEESEFFTWTRLQRRAAWLKDSAAAPAFPDRQHVKCRFGGYARYLAAVQDYWSHRCEVEPGAPGRSRRR